MNGATQTAHEQMMALAAERAKTSGRTVAQEYDEVFRTRHDLRRALAEERLAERQVAAPPPDPNRQLVTFYCDLIARQLQKDRPELTPEQAAVKAFDSIRSPVLRRALAGGR